MQTLALLATALLLLQPSYAHYAFSRIQVNNGPDSQEWQYIRKPANPHFENGGDPAVGHFWPMFDPYSTDIRCGRGADKLGANVETISVNAGDALSIGVDSIPSGTITHGGPGMFYLAKAPDNMDLKDWNGDGNWFKIEEVGHNKSTRAGWLTDYPYDRSMNVTIPKSTPPGKYLLRIEHLFLRTGIKQTNFFVECAHLDIKGVGGGVPGPTVKFPGAYDSFDPAIWAPLRTQGYSLEGYVPPGPKVWEG